MDTNERKLDIDELLCEFELRVGELLNSVMKRGVVIDLEATRQFMREQGIKSGHYVVLMLFRSNLLFTYRHRLREEPITLTSFNVPKQLLWRSHRIDFIDTDGTTTTFKDTPGRDIANVHSMNAKDAIEFFRIEWPGNQL